jgi:predicted patatin/cPLA2 family phospholipase
MAQKVDVSPMGKTGLVLEGGGMRGVYTTGVLDRFLDADIRFPYIIGVSAGASHAVSYITRQRGRARRVNVEYCARADYLGPWCLLREGSLFGMRLLFREIPFRLDLFDFERFEDYDGEYYAVATDLATGGPEYLAPRRAGELMDALQASCSLPFVSKPVRIGDGLYLDGGVADSIPVRRALDDGCDRLVVVLTQPKGFRKKIRERPVGKRDLKDALSRVWYRKYPGFVEALETRNRRYNETLDYIDRLEATGTAIVVRPSPQPGLSRLERDPEVLDGLYRSGLSDAEPILQAVREALTR